MLYCLFFSATISWPCWRRCSWYRYIILLRQTKLVSTNCCKRSGTGNLCTSLEDDPGGGEGVEVLAVVEKFLCLRIEDEDEDDGG